MSGIEKECAFYSCSILIGDEHNLNLGFSFANFQKVDLLIGNSRVEYVALIQNTVMNLR